MASISAARSRARGKPSELIAFTSWALSTYRFGELASGLQPKRFSELLRPLWLEPLELRSELIWCATLIKHFAPQVEAHVSSRNIPFEAALHNDLPAAIAAFDEADARNGLSIWSVAERIALLQIFEGVESAKRLVGQITREARGAQCSFFAYWFGVRIEDRSTVAAFRRNVLSSLQVWNVTDLYKTLIRFLLLNDMPAPEEEAALLCAACSMSIIDLYETFVRLAVFAQAQKRESAQAYALTAKTLAEHICDDRLHLLAEYPDLSAKQVRARGQRLTAVALLQPAAPSLSASGSAIDFEQLLAITSARAEPEVIQGPLWSRLSNALISTAGVLPPSRAANADLTKLAVAFGLSDFGQWANWAKSSEEHEHAFPSQGESMARLAYNGRASFALLPSLPAFLRDALIEACPEPQIARAACGLDPKVAGTLLPPAMRVETALRVPHAKGDFQAMVVINRDAREAGIALTRSMMISEAEALIGTGRLHEAIERCTQQMLVNEAYAGWVPFDRIIAGLDINDWQGLSDTIYTPIFISYYQSEKGGALGSQLSYSTEDFLANIGILYPSEIADRLADFEIPALVAFLDRVCTVQTLRLSTDYETDDDVADERLKICALLAQINSEDSERYEQDAREIVREKLVRDALQELQGSKISIDEEPLLRWAERNLEDDFNRYMAMLRAGTAVIDSKFRETLFAAVRAGQTPLSLEVPKNEASSLFYGIVARFFHECSTNPEHGIDCYLSVRIRHGTVSGMLRGPSEREKIVTRKSAGFYRTNEFWLSTLRDRLSPEKVAQIDERFRRFSQFIDDRASYMTDALIQVSRPDKPKAMFNLAPSEQSVYAIAMGLRPDTTFDEFIASCLELFWQLIELSLVQVRNYLKDDLLNALRGAFDKLDEDFVLLLDSEYAGSLLDAVRRARAETVLAIQTMAGWFELPTPSLSLPFEMPVIVDVALRTFRQFHPAFDPELVVYADGVGPISGILRSHSDIFFTLFENIANHGGHTDRANVSVTSRVVGRRLITTVRNDLGEKATTLSVADLTELKRRICAGEYRERIRKEGGTGLPKVAKLCGLQPGDPDFDFAIDVERGEFQVTFATEFVFDAPEERP